MKRTRRLPQIVVIVAALAGMTGCYAADWLARIPGPVAPSTGTPPPALETTACSWQWATQDLPDLSALAVETLTSAGVPLVEARASAYGENCVTPQGTVERFAAMQTEFDVTLAVASLDDRETIGTLVYDVVGVLMTTLPVERTPGPNQGQIRLRFVAGEDARPLIIDGGDMAVITRGDLSGAALLDALGWR